MRRSLLIASGLLAVGVHALVLKEQADWLVFYKAGTRALLGESIYRYEDLPWVYKYAPVTAYVFAPFAALPPMAARLVWTLLNVILLTRSFALAAALVARRPLPGWAHGVVFFLALASMKHLLLYGNCDGMLLWLALESEALRRSRPALSGLLLALACVFKPPLGLIALVALAWREWRRVAWTVAGGVALLVLPMLLVGPSHAWTELLAWKGMLSDSTGPLICVGQNQGVFGVACWFLSPEDGLAFTLLGAGIGVSLGIALMVLTMGVVRLGGGRGRVVSAAVVIYCTAALSPLGWRNNLVMLLPLLYLLLDVGLQLRSPRAWVALLAVPAFSAIAGLLAWEILGQVRFVQFLELRPFGLSAAVTALSAVAVEWYLGARANTETGTGPVSRPSPQVGSAV